MDNYRIYSLGDSGLTVEFGQSIHPEINDKVIALGAYLKAQNILGVLDIIPSYVSLSIVYDVIKIRKQFPSAFKFISEQVELAIEVSRSDNFKSSSNLYKVVEIPVYYDEFFGIDLAEMAENKNISIEDIITIHTSKSYRVYLIGFLPGLPYMGIVDDQIATPRKKSPRAKVEAGSVGIAGNQTGIYPFDSPGGWNIIGKTPIKMFDPNRATPVYLQPGDEVVFKAISLEDFSNQLYANGHLKNQQENLTAQSSLLITKKGIADSFQDLGRFGYQHLGINPNGAMDKVAAQAANFLVGNSSDEAAIECHFPASSFKFYSDTLIALSGADFFACIDGKEIPLNKPIFVSEGSALEFKNWQSGEHVYIAVQNGFGIEKWLGSYSTNTKVSIGGFKGRNLKKGDVVETRFIASDIKTQEAISVDAINRATTGFHIETDAFYNFEAIEIIEGDDFDSLTEESKIQLLTTDFTISTRSDRMGYRLESGELRVESEQKHAYNSPLSPLNSQLSSAVTRGTMQLLPNGQIIILMADHQTTGGYPKIGQVTTASFPSLAQTPVNKKIRFRMISMEEAEENYVNQYNDLRKIEIACKLRLK